jgi:hypothetical protein
VEIPCITTYIHDKEAFLLQQEEILSESDPPLLHQLGLQRLKLIQTNDLHFCQLKKLATLSGFSGTIEPGTSLEAAALYHADNDTHNREVAQEHAGRDEEGEDDEDEQAGAEVADAFCLVVEGLY